MDIMNITNVAIICAVTRTRVAASAHPVIMDRCVSSGIRAQEILA